MITRRNSFDALRLVAALVVVCSHAVPLALGPQRDDLLWRSTGGQVTFGKLAVLIFFAMSGYLVTQSWERLRDPRAWLWARIVRVWPAYALVIVLLALVLGPIVSSLSPAGYFSNTDLAAFLGNIRLFDLWHSLPGVFDANPTREANASIWTMPAEVACYLLLAAFAWSGALNRRLALVLAGLMLVAQGAYGDELKWSAFITFAPAFWVGVALYLHREAVRWTRPLAALAVVAAALSLGDAWFWPVASVAIPYAALTLARSAALSRFSGRADLSYGTYLLHWPVMQTLVLLLPGIAPAPLLALALPITLALAWASWTFVERPALRLKDWHAPSQRTFAPVRVGSTRWH